MSQRKRARSDSGGRIGKKARANKSSDEEASPPLPQTVPIHAEALAPPAGDQFAFDGPKNLFVPIDVLLPELQLCSDKLTAPRARALARKLRRIGLFNMRTTSSNAAALWNGFEARWIQYVMKSKDLAIKAAVRITKFVVKICRSCSG